MGRCAFKATLFLAEKLRSSSGFIISFKNDCVFTVENGHICLVFGVFRNGSESLAFLEKKLNHEWTN